MRLDLFVSANNERSLRLFREMRRNFIPIDQSIPVHLESELMMATNTAPGSAAITREPTPAEALASVSDGAKPKISPAERWLKIREIACLLAQKRGFVGGNPYEDWAAAEKEVDAKYNIDPDGSSLTAPEQVSAQMKCILKRFGLGDLGVDALLERHQQAMTRLAEIDRTLVEGTADLASKQTALAQDALHEAVNLLQSVSHGQLGADAMAKQANLSMQMMQNALSHLQAVTEAVTGISSRSKKK